jgi:glutamate/tyrosine decarboxylase-like PLP-dependent enzyme
MKEHSIGYQISHDTFFETGTNNAGDPFSKTPFYQWNSHGDERVLVEKFAYDILQCKPGTMWGYCGSGSTESIINGLWMARKRFDTVPTVYASSECHFSVPKAADILGMPFVSVDVNPVDGSMNLEHVSLSNPAVVVLTLGTTIRNAYDHVFQENVPNVHIHVDAAFGGAVYPWRMSEFLKIPFDTFNISFHKFWGCPYPCSLFLVKKSIQQDIQGRGCFGKEMVCLPNKDFTLSCSRNGTAVSMMKALITHKDFFETHVNLLNQCFEIKEYFIHRVVEKRPTQKFRSHPYGLSVELLGVPWSFERIAREKYSMSVRNVQANTFDTHLYICGHVTKPVLNEFLDDLVSLDENPVSVIGDEDREHGVKTKRKTE